MRILRLIPICLLIWTAGCGVGNVTPTLEPPTFTAPPATPVQVLTPASAQKAVAVSLGERFNANYSPEQDFGSTAQVLLTLEPVLMAVTLGPDGTVSSVSTQAWPDAPPLEMEVCFGLDQPCALSGQDWKPLQAETLNEVVVDWLGARRVYARVSVREGNQQTVPVFLRSDSSLQPQVTADITLYGQVNLLTPVALQPGPVQTAIAATRTAYPLAGSVLIEAGACCKGGTAGSTVNLRVTFDAASMSGKVAQMRVSTQGGCRKDAAALDAPWEPFVSVKTYPVQLAINWTGWAVSVQYRDEQGNLSPVYCADISLEGSPPAPTP